MPVHRINAIVAYRDGSVTNYTSAADGQQQVLSKTDPDVVILQLLSWPSFREFLSSLGIVLGPTIDISDVEDIAWSVDMEDDTGRRVISGFEAKGGPGENNNTAYNQEVFTTFFEAIGTLLG